MGKHRYLCVEIHSNKLRNCRQQHTHKQHQQSITVAAKYGNVRSVYKQCEFQWRRAAEMPAAKSAPNVRAAHVAKQRLGMLMRQLCGVRRCRLRYWRWRQQRLYLFTCEYQINMSANATLFLGVFFAPCFRCMGRSAGKPGMRK